MHEWQGVSPSRQTEYCTISNGSPVTCNGEGPAGRMWEVVTVTIAQRR